MHKLQILNIVEDILNRTQDCNGTFKDKIVHLNDEKYIKMFEPIQILQNGSLVMFKYGNYSNIFNSKNNFDISYTNFWNLYDGLYRTLRSIVIDLDSCQIVTYPFDKFFNLNEMEETQLENIQTMIKNAKSVEISDKLDGSMACARFYKGNFFATGSTSIIREQSWRLDEIYRMIESDSKIQLMLKDNPNYTFIFESITKSDVHVVVYDEENFGLNLIGIRDMDSLRLLSYKEVLDIGSKYGIKTTTVFNKTFNEILDSLDEKKSNEKEGFVFNIDGFYMKVKYNDYVLMHGMVSKMSSINIIIKNYADGTIDDLLSKIPTAYQNRVLTIVNICHKYVSNINKRISFWYDKVKDMDIRDVGLYLSQNCDKDIRGYVICKYKNIPYNVLKRGNSGYKKLTDIGVNPSEYYNLFEEI